MTASAPTPRPAAGGRRPWPSSAAALPGWPPRSCCRDAGLTVTVLEGSPRLGGKLAVSEVGGVEVDAGAEALLARRPEGVGLIAELGLSGELRQPGTTSAGIWTRGEVRPLPRRQFMGVPADFDELAATGLLSAGGLARARQDAEQPADPPDAGDVSVTERVGGGWARSWSTASSSRCWAGSTPAAARTCRSRPRWPRWPPPPRATRRSARPPPRCCPPRPPRRPRGPAPGAGVHDAGRRAGQPAPGAGRRVRGRGADQGHRARADPPGTRLAADRRVGARAAVAGGRRGHPGPPGPPGQPPAGRRPRRRRGRRRPGRDQVREHGHRHAGLPGRCLPGPGRRQRLPGPGGGRARHQGGHVQHGQVAAPGPGRPAHRPLLGGPPGRRGRAPARRRRPGRAGRRRPGRGHRRARGPGRYPGHPVGRRAAAVQRGAPGPGGADPGRGGRPARPGGLRRGLRRRRHPGLHRLGAAWRSTRSWPTWAAASPSATSRRSAAGPGSAQWPDEPAEVATLQPAKAATWAVWR